MEKVRLGIIGVGNMGSAHVKNIAVNHICPEVELTAICDVSEERLDWARKTIEDKKVEYFDDAEKMMDSKLIDAVYIATPHYDHPVLAIKAFERGLHVVSEKPAGVYTKKVREMNEAAKKAGVTFAMMFQQRTIPAMKKMKEILSSGEFGQIRSVYWIATNWYRSQFYYDSGSWRATWAGEGGGVLLNQCPHNLDLLQWLCGMPEEISATCKISQWHNIEVEDDVVATLKYKNGAMGTFVATTGVTPGTNRLEIATDKGTLVCEDYVKLTVHELEQKEQDFAKTIKSSFDRPMITNIKYDFPETKDNHAKIINNFAANILHGTPLIVSGEEGINSLTLSNAMYLSDWTKSPIKLPIDEDAFYEELKKRIATSKHKDVKTVIADTEGSYFGVQK